MSILLEMAIQKARKRSQMLKYSVAAVGRRADGVIVTAVNNGRIGARQWDAHAEARLCKKLTPGSIVAVARVRKDGSLGNAMPCQRCMRRPNIAGVYKIEWTRG